MSWLITSSGITASRPDLRLNAIENLLAATTHQWRGAKLISPEGEVRMSEATRDRLLSWVQSLQWAVDPRTANRIARYSSHTVIEPTVPDGWIRVLLQPAAVAAKGVYQE
ncbi:MAG: hypothetical protein ABJE47_09520 [bacterium]